MSDYAATVLAGAAVFCAACWTYIQQCRIRFDTRATAANNEMRERGI